MAQLVGQSSSNQRGAGLIPHQGTYLGFGFGPQGAVVSARVHAIPSHSGHSQSMPFYQMDVSLSPSLQKAMKKCS